MCEEELKEVEGKFTKANNLFVDCFAWSFSWSVCVCRLISWQRNFKGLKLEIVKKVKKG